MVRPAAGPPQLDRAGQTPAVEHVSGRTDARWRGDRGARRLRRPPHHAGGCASDFVPGRLSLRPRGRDAPAARQRDRHRNRDGRSGPARRDAGGHRRADANRRGRARGLSRPLCRAAGGRAGPADGHQLRFRRPQPALVGCRRRGWLNARGRDSGQNRPE